MSFIPKADNKVQPIAEDQLVTGLWADLGNVGNAPWIDVRDCLAIALWLKININDSTDVRIRAACKQSEDASDVYFFPIEEVEAGVVNVASEIKEFSVDADQNMILPFAISDNFPFVKFQVQAGTPGASAATITAGVSFTSNLGGG
jgi:hypothetical protein